MKLPKLRLCWGSRKMNFLSKLRRILRRRFSRKCLQFWELPKAIVAKSLKHNFSRIIPMGLLRLSLMRAVKRNGSQKKWTVAGLTAGNWNVISGIVKLIIGLSRKPKKNKSWEMMSLEIGWKSRKIKKSNKLINRIEFLGINLKSY